MPHVQNALHLTDKHSNTVSAVYLTGMGKGNFMAIQGFGVKKYRSPKWDA